MYHRLKRPSFTESWIVCVVYFVAYLVQTFYVIVIPSGHTAALFSVITYSVTITQKYEYFKYSSVFLREWQHRQKTSCVNNILYQADDVIRTRHHFVDDRSRAHLCMYLLFEEV